MNTINEKQNDQYIRSQFYEAVFMNTPVATAIISGSFDIVSLNPAFETFFQLADEEKNLPVSFEDVSSSFWKKQDFQHYLHTVIENGEHQTEKTFDWQHEDGMLRYIEMKLQLLPDSQPQFLLTFCDASVLKQIEKEHNERIRHMMHELRNPLSNISLCVELLADSTKENNQEDTDMFLTKASASVQRMKQLINDLSAASKAS